jgi:hypothetical protein
MAITDRFCTAHIVEENCELHYSCGGLWGVDTINELFETLNRACAPLVKARKPIYSLGDFSEAIPQDRATAEKIAEFLREAAKFGLKRTAIYGAPVLMKMQYKRVSDGTEVAFFDTKGEALDWLRQKV